MNTFFAKEAAGQTDREKYRVFTKLFIYLQSR